MTTAVRESQTTAVERYREQRTLILTTIADKYSAELGKLAPRGVEPAHYVASLRLYMANNPKILECTVESVARGILRVAQTGLTLGESCDLLPFKKQCQFSPRYNGIIELALAAGTRAINADVVREGEFFRHLKGTRFFLEHEKSALQTAPIRQAYAVAEVKQGSFVFDVWQRADVDAHRQRYSQSWYKTKEGQVIPLEEIPWYAKKTMVRQLSPFLPKNARLAAALLYARELEELPTADEGLPTQSAEDTGREEALSVAAQVSDTEDLEFGL